MPVLSFCHLWFYIYLVDISICWKFVNWFHVIHHDVIPYNHLLCGLHSHLALAPGWFFFSNIGSGKNYGTVLIICTCTIFALFEWKNTIVYTCSAYMFVYANVCLHHKLWSCWCCIILGKSKSHAWWWFMEFYVPWSTQLFTGVPQIRRYYSQVGAN